MISSRITTFLKKLCLIGIAFTVFVLICFPKPKLKSLDYSGSLYSKGGDLISYSLSKDSQWRLKLRSKELPGKLISALLTLEDKRFFYHPGVDPLAIIRASYNNTFNKKVAFSGGSTLTMQVARLIMKNSKRRLWSKIKEVHLALRLELYMSKNDILREYLQRAPYGGNLVGLETASWFYFNRPTRSLSWSEASLLAVLPQKPSSIRVDKNRRQLKIKRDALLQKLHTNKLIKKDQYEISLKTKLPKNISMPKQIARHILYTGLKENQRRSFESSLDYNLQKQSLKLLNTYASSLKEQNILNSALVIIDNESGEPLAFHGNSGQILDQERGQFINIALSPRSTGSTLKPFLYAAMLDEGLINPESLVFDIPTWINGFHPKNFSGHYLGAVRAKEALAMSLNIPAVLMLKDFGAERFHRDLVQLNFTNFFRHPETYGLSLILGGGEANLFELTRAYSYLAQRAMSRDHIFSTDLWGNTNKTSVPYSIGASYLTLEALLKVKRPDLQAYWEEFSSSQKIAWKTGTSHGFKDAWAIGVTKKYSVGVWIGNATGEGRPEIIGTKTAAPLMFSVFNYLDKSTWFDFPEINLKKTTVCRNSGFLSRGQCRESSTWTPEGSFYSNVDKYNHRITVDKKSGLRAHLNCRKPSEVEFKTFFSLPKQVAYYLKKSKHQSFTPPRWAQGCKTSRGQKSLAIIHPLNEAHIILPKEIDGETQPIVFQAHHDSKDSKIFWHLDNTFLGTTKMNHSMELKPKPGQHKITLVDQDGLSESIVFSVVEKNTLKK